MTYKRSQLNITWSQLEWALKPHLRLWVNVGAALDKNLHHFALTSQGGYVKCRVAFLKLAQGQQFRRLKLLRNTIFTELLAKIKKKISLFCKS